MENINNIEQINPTNIQITPRVGDKLKIRCPYCFHNMATRNINTRNIREAVFLCDNCGKKVK